MQSPFETTPDATAIPITFATKTTWERDPLRNSPNRPGNLRRPTTFAAKPGECLTLPSADGEIAHVLFGLEAAPRPAEIRCCRAASRACSRRHLPLRQCAARRPPGRARVRARRLPLHALPQGDGSRAAGLPEGVDGAELSRIAEGVTLARDLDQHAGQRHGPGRAGGSRARCLPQASRRGVEAIVGDDLLTQNFPLIHAVGRAAARRAAPDRPDAGAMPTHPKVTLVGKGVCFDTGGLDIKPPAPC